MNNLRRFNSINDYEAAELVKPAVSLIADTDEVYFDQKEKILFSGLTVYYNIDTAGEYTLFNGGGGSGSGSGSGSGGALPSAMIVDGTEVEVTATYQFDTVGEHIVQYSFADNQIPNNFMDGFLEGGDKFHHLVGIEIGDAITSIGGSAFAGCSGLTSIEIPDSVTSIGNNAFDKCSGLTSCTIGSGVTSIANSAFVGCSSLTSIEIPDSVTSIGDSAFYVCSGLTSCTIGSGVTSIANSAFLGCYSLTSITVDSNNTIYDSRNDCNAIIATSTNTLVQGCKTTMIPNSVTSIGNTAFASCSGLTSIDIPSSVTSIGGNAFNKCTSLSSIDIPSSVTSIGNNAFDGCSSLTSCTIGSGVTSIGTYAFRDCSSLSSITVNATTAPTITYITFSGVKTSGTLYIPSGSSGYDIWMRTSEYYLGYYNWTKVEQ